MKIAGIYKITNPVNEVYIGKSIDIHKRWQSYFNMNCSAQPLIYQSLFDYGLGNHKFEIIEEYHGNSTEELSKLEAKWYELYYYNHYEMLNAIPPSIQKKRLKRKPITYEEVLIMRERLNNIEFIYNSLSWSAKKSIKLFMEVLKLLDNKGWIDEITGDKKNMYFRIKFFDTHFFNFKFTK